MNTKFNWLKLSSLPISMSKTKVVKLPNGWDSTSSVTSNCSNGIYPIRNTNTLSNQKSK